MLFSDNEDVGQSMMSKNNHSVIVLSALRKSLYEVDEDANGQIDWEEFKEVLTNLKSSFNGINASKIFYSIADAKNHELDINKFIKDMQCIYEMYPNITGDQCIQKVSNKYHDQKKSGSGSGSGSGSASFVTSSSISINDEKETETEKEKEDIIKNVKNALNLIDEDQNGLIDKEEFVDFLGEWGLDEKLSDDDLNKIFFQLINQNEIEHDEASCDLFLHSLHQVHDDHPNYSARRAVYRVCRRLLKAAQNK